MSNDITIKAAKAIIAVLYLAEVFEKEDPALHKRALALALSFMWAGSNSEWKEIEKDLLQEDLSVVISYAVSTFRKLREKSRKNLTDTTKIKNI